MDPLTREVAAIIRDAAERAILPRFQPQTQFWHDVWAGTRLINWVAPAKKKPLAADETAAS